MQTIGNTKFIKGSILYEIDFSKQKETDTLPDGFDLAVPLFSENENKTLNASIVKDNKTNVLRFTSSKSDAFLTIPQIKTQDYIFEAELVIKTEENATLGIVNDMQGGASVAKGATICVLRLNESKSIWSYYSRALEDWDGIDAESLGHPMDNPKNGDRIKLKLISFENYNYLFVNEKLIANYPQPIREGNTDNIGFYLSDGQINIENIKVTAACSVKFSLVSPSFNVNTDEKKTSITINASFNKNNDFYKSNYSDGYSYSKKTPIKFGFFLADNTVENKDALNENTKNIQSIFFTDFTETDESLNLTYNISDIPNEMLDKHYTLRAFALVEDEYFYFDSTSFSVLRLANTAFLNANDSEREIIKEKFGDIKGFNSTGLKSITFGLFSDFHYKEGMYISSIADLDSIFERAYNSHASFVISAGDMTNDMIGSPELVNGFKNNKYGLGAYNVYGNHELESAGNTMEVVTPTLTNDENVVWGTQSGKIEDGSIGYYYTDREGFRLVFVDSNYYFDEETNSWKHNPPAYWGPPPGGTKIQSLGPEQLVWLEKVLIDAANKDIPCIITAHNTFSSKIVSPSGDAAKVREIYKKANEIQPGTVILSINGHIHTDSYAYEDGVFYFDMNTTRNLWWQPSAEKHYYENHTYEKEVYDANGILIETVETPLNTELCWYSDAPLSAIITVNENGVVEIEGSKADWIYGIIPRTKSSNTKPMVSSGTFKAY